MEKMKFGVLLFLSCSSFILHPSSFLSPSSFAGAQEEQKVHVGLTPAETRKILGEPAHLARQLLYHRCRECWVYDQPQPLCLVFDWQRGQLPRLTAIHSVSPLPGK